MKQKTPVLTDVVTFRSPWGTTVSLPTVCPYHGSHVIACGPEGQNPIVFHVFEASLVLRTC